MNFFYVRILYVTIVICLCLFNYKDSATKCCKNNFYFLSCKRCLLQHMVEEPFEKKGTCGVLLKDKKNEEGRRKKIRETINIKPLNENNNNNNIGLKNINDKGVEKISNNRQMMGEKNIIYKDINSNEIINKNGKKDNQKVDEIKGKIVKDLMKNKNKEISKQMEIINSDGTMTKIKNSLYNMIFRGVNFWKGLAIYLGTLSGAAGGQLILACILKFAMPSWLPAAVFSPVPSFIAFGSFVGIILLSIIIVICLLVWLWPSRGKLMGKDKTGNERDT
ncbi:Plasmodium exported protein, unknown function [Plasmodium sp. gorilla clade G1]|nr:Plasmodium exported protein, unknown function [Plasmodium sp. gorilla clade G1]